MTVVFIVEAVMCLPMDLTSCVRLTSSSTVAAAAAWRAKLERTKQDTARRNLQPCRKLRWRCIWKYKRGLLSGHLRRGHVAHLHNPF